MGDQHLVVLGLVCERLGELPYWFAVSGMTRDRRPGKHPSSPPSSASTTSPRHSSPTCWCSRLKHRHAATWNEPDPKTIQQIPPETIKYKCLLKWLLSEVVVSSQSAFPLFSVQLVGKAMPSWLCQIHAHKFLLMFPCSTDLCSPSPSNRTKKITPDVPGEVENWMVREES